MGKPILESQTTALDEAAPVADHGMTWQRCKPFDLQYADVLPGRKPLGFRLTSATLAHVEALLQPEAADT
jgi:hypothetical protein